MWNRPAFRRAACPPPTHPVTCETATPKEGEVSSIPKRFWTQDLSIGQRMVLLALWHVMAKGPTCTIYFPRLVELVGGEEGYVLYVLGQLEGRGWLSAVHVIPGADSTMQVTVSEKFTQLFRMSWSRAVVRSSLPATTKHVLLTLALHCSTMEPVTPEIAVRQLEDETSLSERTVRYHLGRAEAAGWIKRVTREAPNGRRLPNRYVLVGR